MKAVVLAAGEGTRLRLLTEDKPKGMVKVDGKPILTHCFEQMAALGADKLVVVAGYMNEAIISHYGDEFDGMPITYTHQREQLGLAHVVLQTEPHVDGQFVVLNGDNVFEDGIGAAVEQAAELGADATLLVEEVKPEAACETGVVEVDEGQVTSLVERPDEPPSRLATTGCYVLPRDIFAAARLLRPSARGEYELTGAVGVLVRAGATVEAVRYSGERCNVNTPAGIEQAKRLPE